MIFIAQAPDPQSLWNFLSVLGWLAILGVNLATLIGFTRTQRREVSFSTRYASSDDLAEIKRDIDGLRAELRDHRESSIRDAREWSAGVSSRIEEVRREFKTDISHLHRRTDEILAAVSTLSGKVDTIHT